MMLTVITSVEAQVDRLLNRSKNLVSRLWQTDAPLTGTGLLMLAVLAASLDRTRRSIRATSRRCPAWLKPAKFATSIAIYALTLAWVFTYLPEWVKTRRIVGWTTRDRAHRGDRHHRPPGVARDDQPLQHRHAGRRHAVGRDGHR